MLCCYSATKGVLPNETFNKRSPPSHREVIACQLPKSHLSFGTPGPSPSRVSHAPPDSPRPRPHIRPALPPVPHPRHSSGALTPPVARRWPSRGPAPSRSPAPPRGARRPRASAPRRSATSELPTSPGRTRCGSRLARKPPRPRAIGLYEDFTKQGLFSGFN